MNDFWRDFRFGLRKLAARPVFTAVAVLTIALGIGLNTTMFGVVNAVLLKDPGFRNPDELVVVWEHNRPRDRRDNVVSPANYLAWKERNQVFSDMAAFSDRRYNLSGAGAPEEVPLQVVTDNFFSVLGVGAVLGRTFTQADGRPDAERVVVVSHGFWKRMLGGDPSAVGKPIRLNGNQHTVVGVLPPDYRLFLHKASFNTDPPEVWAPFQLPASARTHGGRFLSVVARLKPGVSVEQARAEMTALAGALEREFPDRNREWGVSVVPVKEQLVGETRPALLILMAAVGCVLLIACANIANLLLAQSVGRQKEMAVRTALGAGRSRIVRQLLTEHLTLAGLGGVLGCLSARWGVELVKALAPANALGGAPFRLDWATLGFAAAVSLGAGVLFGIAPALESSKIGVSETLKETGSSTSSGFRNRRVRRVLVVAEIAVSLVLLVCAGLLVRSFVRLRSVDPGFRSENVLTFRMTLPGAKYKDAAPMLDFYQRLIERIERLPGVRAVGTNSFLPLAGPGSATSFSVEGRPAGVGGEMPVTDVRVVNRTYFAAMSVPLLKGRLFNSDEERRASGVVVVNETLAREFFPNENPIGKRITIEMKPENTPSEIIGVVGDVRHVGLDAPARAMSYWPPAELPMPFATVVVKTEGDSAGLVSAIRNEVAALDPEQPIAQVRTMKQWIAASTEEPRFTTTLGAVFAGIAVLLSAIGMYGVISYMAGLRAREFGIRMALGASRRDVLKLVLAEGMGLTGVGLGLGLLGAWGAGRFLKSLLFGVETTDAPTFALGALVTIGVVLLACLLPARRAMNQDPTVVLRFE